VSLPARAPEHLCTARLQVVERCPICSGKEFSVIGSRPTIHPAPTMGFDVLRCHTCGHWFTSPMPESDYLLDLYAEGSLSVLGEGWEDQTRESNAIGVMPGPKVNWITSREKRIDSVSSYLELGPGDFSLFRHFSSRGWDCYAVEPGSWSHKSDRIFTSVSELPREIHFDVIVALDVLEHLSDPLSQMGAMADLLTTSGRMYLSSPNVRSVRARLNGLNWRMVSPIGHLHYFSPMSIQLMLSRSNLKPVSIGTYDLLTPAPQRLRQSLRSLRHLDLKGSAWPISDLMTSWINEAVRGGDQWRVIAMREE